MTAVKNGTNPTGQVALVTGASRLHGIGAAICRAPAAHGADVAFNHWCPADEAFPWSGAPSEPEDLAQELVTLGVRTAAIECDLSNPGAGVWPLDESESHIGPMPDELAYGATKGAIEVFTRSLAPAVAAKGITVNAVDPGPTDSGWITPELRDVLLPRFPMGRLGTPADAARLVAWLPSPDAGWVTGQVIHSRGGFNGGLRSTEPSPRRMV